MDVRLVKAEDLEALGQIAYVTGFFGQSAKPYFPSESLFCELWVKPYLAEVGSCGYVAVLENAPVGYVLGTSDLHKYQRYFLRHLPDLIKNGVLGAYPKLGPSLGFLLRGLCYPSRLAPFKAYPAQLHINLLPTVRGQGLGETLLKLHLDCLKARGVRGVQLSTTHENMAAVRLYTKLGFTVYSRWSSPLWKPWLGREVVHLVMVLSL